MLNYQIHNQIFFFYRYIITHTFKQHKILSTGTKILGVPGKIMKRNL